MFFRLFRFTFRAVSMTSSFNIAILEDMCQLKSSMQLFLISFLLLKWLSLHCIFVMLRYHMMRIKAVRAVSWLMIRMITVQAKILVYLMLIFLCWELPVLMIILTVSSGVLGQICGALRLFLQSLFSLTRILSIWLIWLMTELALTTSSLILNLLTHFLRI